MKFDVDYFPYLEPKRMWDKTREHAVSSLIQRRTSEACQSWFWEKRITEKEGKMLEFPGGWAFYPTYVLALGMENNLHQTSSRFV